MGAAFEHWFPREQQQSSTTESSGRLQRSMLGYAGENERVLPAAASSSSDSDSDAETHFVMDPSDPRAHDKSQKLKVHPTREPSRKCKKSKKPVGAGGSVSRWDSESHSSGQSTGGDDDEEDVGERVPIQVVFNADNDENEGEEDEELGSAVDLTGDEGDGGDEEEKEKAANSAGSVANSKVKLSKWALSRFLVPREERNIPVFEELPIEPLNDHILSDFGTRFRGDTGELTVEKDIDDAESEEEESDKFTVGAPLFSSTDKSADGNGVDRAAGRKAHSADNNSTSGKGPTRKRPENRYFITDLATKCFNCGQIGHMSALCMNDRVLKPCYYCGLRGHMAMNCPHLPCPTCLQLGHTSRVCSNRPLKLDNCGVCGRIGHEDEDCENVDVGFEGISCMVCVKPGHLTCVPVPPPADRKIYCPNCTDKHLLNECSSYVEPSQPNFATSNFRMMMKCFVCQNPGHLAAECPQRNTQMNNFNCFKCGQRGHYASDCPSNSRSNNNSKLFTSDNRQNSRKRGRDQYDGGYRDEDEDDNYYYQVPGGNSRSYSSNNNNNKKSYPNVRLDAALPSYRNNSNSNNNRNSYNNNGNNRNNYNNNNNSNNDRRRGGGGRWR